MTLSGRYLVTGGAGFIGSHLTEHLIGLGLDVVVLDNFRNGTIGNLKAVSDSPRLRVIEGDILDQAACTDACRDVVGVFHLACLGVRHSLHNPMENHAVNATGTLNVLEAARVRDVRRFVYVSTSEVYGRATDFPILETTTPWPLTVYGASKLAGEHYARAYYETYGMPTIRVRPFNNYGPRSHFEGDAGEVIPRVLMRALTGKRPIIFGDGLQTRDFLYVKDCARALVDIAECDQLVGDVINLGVGQEVSMNDLVASILQAVDRTDLVPIHEQDRPADVPRLWLDPTLLHASTAFRPAISLHEGITHTLAYFRSLISEHPESSDLITTKNWEA